MISMAIFQFANCCRHNQRLSPLRPVSWKAWPFKVMGRWRRWIDWWVNGSSPGSGEWIAAASPSGSIPPRTSRSLDRFHRDRRSDGGFLMFFLGETKANPQETVSIGLIVPIVNSHLGKQSAIFRPKSLKLVETSIATLELKRKQRTVGRCLG